MNTSTEKLVADAKVLATDVESSIRAAADQSVEKIAAARNRVQSAFVSAREGAVVHGREAAHRADTCVRVHPWSAVGIAAGLGLLLGIVIGRR
jgi:ElaB/YqjD/DUF883 family membrane-anchored ribosome-binding protein